MEYGHIPGINKPISRLVQGTVMVTSETATAATIRLINSAGVIVSKQAVSLTKGSNNIFLKDVAGLGKGMYIMEMVSETEITRIKIIKQ